MCVWEREGRPTSRASQGSDPRSLTNRSVKAINFEAHDKPLLEVTCFSRCLFASHMLQHTLNDLSFSFSHFSKYFLTITKIFKNHKQKSTTKKNKTKHNLKIPAKQSTWLDDDDGTLMKWVVMILVLWSHAPSEPAFPPPSYPSLCMNTHKLDGRFLYRVGGWMMKMTS